MKIGFIGNFIPPHSTENDRKWSFEKLGHEVITFQENATTEAQLLRVGYLHQIDLLLYSHTHDPSYVIPNLKEVFAKYKELKIPTVSVHLDRWAWLKRSEDVGNEATWFTEYIFMADASPEAVGLYDKLKLNWHYLRPGVVERDCKILPPDHIKFPHEIVFTGSKGYHPEYPWRKTLIDWLQETYGNRFGHYGNDGIRVVRGDDLNILYSTAKIVVGDSCFGGRPNYVSDRYYEVRGRGGFLLHPDIKGVDSYGVGHYGGYGHDSTNFKSLREQIDYFLEHSYEREEMRKIGFEWVKQYETYTNRAQEILDVIFKDK